MKVNATVTVIKDAVFDFPDSLFTPEHIKDVNDYVSGGDAGIHSAEDMRRAVIEYYGLHGACGYAEHLGCHILWGSHQISMDGMPVVMVSREDSDIDEVTETPILSATEGGNG